MPVLAPFIDAVAQRVAEIITEKKSEVEKKPRYYTRLELCDILHVTPTTVDNMAKSGTIHPLKCGRKVLYDADVIDSLIERKQIYRYKHKAV